MSTAKRTRKSAFNEEREKIHSSAACDPEVLRAILNRKDPGL